jgi:hypothetical protein
MGRIAATVVAVALTLAGCGGSDPTSDEQVIEDTVKTYFTAFADGDGQRACDQLSSSVQGQIEKATKAKDCATALEAAAQQPEFKQYVDELRDVEVLKVTVADRDATAKIKAIGQTTTMPLRKDGDTWKIQDNEVAVGG